MASNRVESKAEIFHTLSPTEDLLLSFDGECYFAHERSIPVQHVTPSRGSHHQSGSHATFPRIPGSAIVVVRGVSTSPTSPSHSSPSLRVVVDDKNDHDTWSGSTLIFEVFDENTISRTRFDASTSPLHAAELCAFWYALFDFLIGEVFARYDIFLSLVVYVWVGMWFLYWLGTRSSHIFQQCEGSN